MAETSLPHSDASRCEGTDPETTAASAVAEVTPISNLTVDRRVRLALELASFAVEHGGENGRDVLALGRQLRAVADRCTEAAMLSHGLVGRSRA